MKVPPYGSPCDPFDLYPLSAPAELEALTVLAVAVAGRTPRVVWPKVAALKAAAAAAGHPSLFPFLRAAAAAPGGLDGLLRGVRMGQYTRIARALDRVCRLPPGWAAADLAAVPGVKFKTAKLVEVYTWPGLRAVCLDRHVLRLLAAHPKTRWAGVPAASPTCPYRYAGLEGLALRLADDHGLTPWEFDRAVWRNAAAGLDPVAALEKLRPCRPI